MNKPRDKKSIPVITLFLVSIIVFISSCEKSYQRVAEREDTHEEYTDYLWDTTGIKHIYLNGNAIATDFDDGAMIDGSIITIMSPGIYGVKGNLDDGQIIIDASTEDIVRLILYGVSIHNSSSAPLFIKQTEKTIIGLPEGTDNYFSDASSYISTVDNEPNAAIFSKSDLTFFGDGSLTVNADFNDAVSSKDGLIINGGIYNITAPDDGIRGKDYLVIKDGNITVESGGDGLKSDNEENDTRGFIIIEDGTFNISSGTDAIHAENDLVIEYAEMELITGGGSSHSIDYNSTAKGLKAGYLVEIHDGIYYISSADDAIHSDGTLEIEAGAFTIYTADDAIRSETSLEINGGNISIEKCYEGIESEIITINKGIIHITSSDDGLNAGSEGGIVGPPHWKGDDAKSEDNYIYLNGGNIVINSSGDGIDANGSLEITGGNVIINGPTANDNGALDYNYSCKITGGLLLAAGSAGMAQAPDQTSSQVSILIIFNSTLQAGTLVHMKESGGEDIFTFSPQKRYQSLVISSPDIKTGSTYDIYIGGSSTGILNDGLYTDGVYTAGTKYITFTVSKTIITIR